MKSKREPILLALILLGFVGLTIGLFLPKSPILVIFSLYLFLVLTAQSLRLGPLAYMMTGFSTFLGIFCLSKVGESEVLAIPMLILTLWGCVFLLHLHMERIKSRQQKSALQDEDRVKRNKVLKKEIAYYEGKKQELLGRAAQRRQLVHVARKLGSLLDPQAILVNLIKAAQDLFPDKPVKVSYGQAPDAVDRFVIQKRQPVVVPGDFFKGNPMMAVPVSAQRSVAGILRVGGLPGDPFTRDDLRLLDILGGLASLALDNSMLFKQVQDSALRDGLTGLITHRAFQDNLDRAILEASRYNQQLSIILTDVDHFKSINDTYGHQTGDEVLQGMAHVMVRNVRDVDVVSRYGGEEFVVLLLQTNHEEALKIAEQIREDLEAQRFDAGGKVIEITASFGVATYPDDSSSTQQLMGTADQRLYKAKEGGRNQVKGKAA